MTSEREALISVNVIGADRTVLEVSCILDTGFSGYLTLRPDEIYALGLRRVSHVEIELGNGRTDRASTFAGVVEWDGLERGIVIQESIGYHLLGMHLLEGCSLAMDICVDGSVMIEPDTCEPFE